jgi:hypothetical protein
MLRNLANAVMFQVGWFTCVLGGNSRWLLITGVVLCIHVWLIGSWHTEGKLLMSAFALGCVVDSALIKVGVLDLGHSGRVIPLWLALLWPLLATTLGHCLAWTGKRWWLASVLGAIGGPFSYIAGSHLTYVQLPLGLWPSAIILAMVWAVIFPLLHGVAARFRTPPASEASV